MRTVAPLLLSLLVAPVVLAGCGGGDTDGETASATQSSEEDAEATTAEGETADDGTTDAPAFPANAEPDTADPSSGASVTVSDIRVGRQDGFDRVVFEVGGTGTPGWDVRYVDAATSQGSGDAVDVAGDAVLQVTLTGVGYPYDTGVEEYSGVRAAVGRRTPRPSPRSSSTPRSKGRRWPSSARPGDAVPGLPARGPGARGRSRWPTRPDRVRSAERGGELDRVVGDAGAGELDSGPAVTLSPSPQDTLAPPTLSVARPSWVPPNDSVVPRISASAPSPLSVTVHELGEQDTLFERERAAGQRDQGQRAGEQPGCDPGGAGRRRRGHGPSLGRGPRSASAIRGDAGGRRRSPSAGCSPAPFSAGGTTVRWMVTSVSPRPPRVISS